MSWGLWKTLAFEDCLEKFGCTNRHVKKSFFLRFAQFSSNNFYRGDPGPNLLVKFILCHDIGVYQLEKKFELGLNTKCVFSSYFSVATTFFTFLTGQKT